MLTFFQLIMFIPDIYENYMQFEEYWKRQLKYIGNDYEHHTNEIFDQIVSDYIGIGINSKNKFQGGEYAKLRGIMSNRGLDKKEN